jgi:hypothetical protein
MAQFKSFVPNVEVAGITILAFIAGIKQFKERAYEMLSLNGIAEPKVGVWYLQQNYLNAFKLISEKVGPSTLYQIGSSIPANAQWPPNIKSLEDALTSIDVAYHLNHRLNGEILYNPTSNLMKEGIGHYRFTKVDARKAKMVCENPYPCDFDRGLIESVSNKFKPIGVAAVVVIHDDTQPCRKKGLHSCTYKISW